jgi:2-hydroxy-4-carboxymuconate semialdehyde hemiacetal dehydrogenase
VSPPRDVRIALVGEGAMGRVHAGVLSKLPGVRITSLVAGDAAAGESFASEWNIPHCSPRFEESLARDDVDAVVVASPSGLHETHAVDAATAGKPALIEIPVALTLAGAERVAAEQRRTGVPLMVAHTRRFSAPHRHLRGRIRAGSFHLQHLVVETYFMRRSNLNMFGKPRSWTDHLLWHHACHSVDLAAWLLDDDFDVWASHGPLHPELGIAMDMSIGLRGRRSGALVTMALSFNHHGPFGGFYRYIGEEGTYHVFRDTIKDGDGAVVALADGATPAFEVQDRAFVDAVRSGTRPACDADAVLPAMRLLDRIERAMSEPCSARPAHAS